MRNRPVLVVFAVAAVTGCAMISFSNGLDPREQLAAGALALEKQDHARARELLEPLYFQHWKEPEGQQAVLMLIASELDGRNPDRRLWAAADMAARLLQIPTLQAWMVPIVESYYTLAVELGATEQRVADAEARASRAEVRNKPSSPREPWPDQVKRKERELMAVNRRVATLEEQNATLDKELKDTKQELERIKKTIRP